MADASIARAADQVSPEGRRDRSSGQSSFARVARYTISRTIALFITIVIGVYATILIANMGGYVDEIRLAQIEESVAIGVSQNPEYRSLTSAQRQELVAGMVEVERQRLGLDRPFVVRSFTYLTNALTLDLGRSEYISSDRGSRQVRQVILERLAPTLILFASANLILFFVAIFVGLFLSRRYGSWLDRLVIALAPTSAAPSWFFGIFLILVFAALLGVLPFGGMVATPPPPDRLDYALSVLKHLILPVSAIIIGAVFITIYSWRTFFLIYSSEDYVEMAKAKGLPSTTIERRYVLRPTLPTIITSFALLVIQLWTGGIVLETVFNWPGLGRLLFQAINLFDTPIIVASVVIFAYLLAVTVFLLDIIYALVDPRVKVDSGGAV